jgi:hypothetical protein
MLLLNAGDDTTRPTHLPPPPMTDRRIRRLTNKEIREIAEDEIPVALERLMGGSHDARAIAFAELTKFARAIIACAIATPAPEELEPNDSDVGRILRLAEIVREVDGKHDLSAAVLAEAILAHPGFSGCHDGPVAAPAQGEVAELVAALEADAECVAAEHYDLCNMTADQMRRIAELLNGIPHA